ncbi:hypothetical protein KKI24_17710 [bacterium]|nr:hypothetical protein [bacterium]
MAKLKKYEKVDNYLRKLKEQGDMTARDLMKLHFKDLVDLPEFEGIGDRTISNVLKNLKKELGVLPKTDTISKRQRVREYLDRQLQSGEMSGDQMLELHYQDLMEREALKGIGKTTISCALSTYKKNYEKQVFESNILNFLDQKKTAETSDVDMEADVHEEEELVFSQNDLSVLRQMVKQFQGSFLYSSESQNMELRELKLALRFSGIDCQRILELYWKSRKKPVFPIHHLVQSHGSENLVQSQSEEKYALKSG